jgi:ketol-acid reductoisomerase
MTYLYKNIQQRLEDFCLKGQTVNILGYGSYGLCHTTVLYVDKYTTCKQNTIDNT